MSSPALASPDKIAAYLRRRDKTLGAVIKQVGPLELVGPGLGGRPSAHYDALVRAIVGQQLSVHAARAIYIRFLGYFNGQAPTPKRLLKAPQEELRQAAGLSRAKVAYLYSLAEHTLDGSLDLAHLETLDDEQVIAQLTQVKGLGTWTAHMYLIFYLARPDVLAVGDLGIRKAVRNLYSLDSLPDAAIIEEIAAPWRPHSSTACRYLWRSLDMKPV